MDSITNYAVTFTGMSANVIVAATCMDGACKLLANLPFSCSSSTSIDVSVSVINRLGQGPPSNPISIGMVGVVGEGCEGVGDNV